MLNWYLRYEPIISLLDRAGAESVLDVGSGWWGLSWYWPHAVVQTDFAFAGSPPSAGRAGQARFVRASAERLPFADGSFDYAVSSDMLEHLPAEIREQSIRELQRVARRGVIVGFPAGEAARALDRRLARLLHLLRRSQPDWLTEHLRQVDYPDRRAVADALDGEWTIRECRANGNATLQLGVVVAEWTPGLKHVTTAIERRLARRRSRVPFHGGRTMREIYHLQRSGSDARSSQPA